MLIFGARLVRELNSSDMLREAFMTSEVAPASVHVVSLLNIHAYTAGALVSASDNVNEGCEYDGSEAYLDAGGEGEQGSERPFFQRESAVLLNSTGHGDYRLALASR